jgi:hypothetical protein
MTNETAALRAWLDTHGLADAELLQADRRAQRSVRPTARHHGAPPPGRRPAHRDREEKRER